ncbi:MAG: hypothetical protein Q7L55_06725 [Actinomycetota bacterium]|nr:hypothetical protein [Actinomycetota bacterium]
MSPIATISNIADHGAKVRRQSWTLHVDPVGDLYKSALDCEQAVFLQAYGNTIDELNNEYGPYDDSSFLISVTDESGYTVGVCRIITPGVMGTKTLNDINASPWFAESARLARACGIAPDKTWDIATLGVRAEYRTQAPMVTMALLHAMVATTRANAIPAVTAMLDERARRFLSFMDVHFSTFPGVEAGEYLGSAATRPVYMDIVKMLSANRTANPITYRTLTLGEGLEGMTLPSRESLRVRTPQQRAAARQDVVAELSLVAG